jgi:AraC-like DNA-binding protein
MSGVRPAHWRGRTFLAPGLILYSGRVGAADEHAHHALQLLWCVDGLLELEVAGERLRAEAVLLPAGVPHAIRTGGGRIALALIEPQGPRGVALDSAAHQQSSYDVGAQLTGMPDPTGVRDVRQALAWCDTVLSQLGWRGERPSPSVPVQQALAHIESHPLTDLRLGDVAAAACLSPSRLTHSFTQEVGIPFRRYVLWVKVKRAVEAVGRGCDLTRAAAEAGFSDSAHLSRVIRANFGVPPSSLVNGLTLIGGFWAPPESAATFKPAGDRLPSVEA